MAATIAAVSSLDPSSTTRISNAAANRGSSRRSSSSVWRMRAASLNAGMTMESGTAS
jgi:hypothetical protein